MIDEIQRRPDLFPVLRVLADRRGRSGALPDPRQCLGRPAAPELGESGGPHGADRDRRLHRGRARAPRQRTTLWRRGGFPLVLPGAHASRTASPGASSSSSTLLERDLPQWGVRVPAAALQRFWTMVAHYHGQTWNAAEPARALGVNPSTCRRYLDLLTDALMIRQLQPWHANLGKRQVKSPKVYVRDSGLLHQLLGIGTEKALLSHPKLGASWEGFVIEQVLAARTSRRCLVLGDAPGSGDRPDPAAGRPAVGRRVQARRRAAPDAVDSHRPGGSGAGMGERHLPRRQAVSHCGSRRGRAASDAGRARRALRADGAGLVCTDARNLESSGN